MPVGLRSKLSLCGFGVVALSVALVEGCSGRSDVTIGPFGAGDDGPAPGPASTTAPEPTSGPSSEAPPEPDSPPSTDVDASTNVDASTGDSTAGMFPETFAFGTAIAGFQVDMGCPTVAAATCEDRASDWFQWITTARILDNPFLYASKDPPAYGPGFRELFAEDLHRARAELHGNAVRLSIEWSRIFPRATYGISGYAALRLVASADGLAYYHRLFAAMKREGLRPNVTVSHYSLPLWVHDGNACNQDLTTCAHKGWVDRAIIVPEIAKYAGFLGREFGAEVDEWATLNEPFTAVTLAGYITPTATRVNPPGLYLKANAARTATAAMIEAHARMYDALKAADKVDADGDGTAASVGLVYAITAVAPNADNDADRAAAADARYFMNDLFLQGVAKGVLDEKWDGTGVVRKDLAGRLDWLGVNYYTRIKAQATRLGGFNPLRFVSPFLTFNLLNMQADMNYPEGIHEVLVDAAKYGVPMVVSETGIDQASDAGLGPTWVVRTLQGVKKGLDEGLDVRGYYAWSLMDNYEWNHGMNQRFGMYAVDPRDPTKARVARPIVPVYGRIANERRIAPELAKAYGMP